VGGDDGIFQYFPSGMTESSNIYPSGMFSVIQDVLKCCGCRKIFSYPADEIIHHRNRKITKIRHDTDGISNSELKHCHYNFTVKALQLLKIDS